MLSSGYDTCRAPLAGSLSALRIFSSSAGSTARSGYSLGGEATGTHVAVSRHVVNTELVCDLRQRQRLFCHVVLWGVEWYCG